MELLSAVVLTYCLTTGSLGIPTGVAENLQLNSIYEEFPVELKTYLTEEQINFLDNTYITVNDKIHERVVSILEECENKKAEEEEERKAIEEQERIKQEEERIKLEQEIKHQTISNNIYYALSITPSPGLNWCAKYVSMVYQNAGYGYINGNACDMYWNYCFSADRNQLRNGMIVAVPSWNGDYMSYTYGHVGIYMDGFVWHNTGSIIQTPLDEWISFYGQICQVRWGFPIAI